MDRSSLCFLNILRSALKGRPLDRDPGLSREEWEAVFRMASAHKVLPLVFEAVHSLPSLAVSPLLPPLKRSVVQQVVVQTRKTAELLALLDRLSARGIRPLVVKGLVCRQLYPRPELRPSADEDLLVEPARFSDCRAGLEALGFRTALSPEAQADAYEVPFRSPGGALCIELHRHLFPPESRSYGQLEQFFRKASSRAVCMSVSGTDVYTLEHTDHLFYLICHAFKHFLHSGFGIRQVCDILLFASAYGQRIDWDRLERSCRRIRAWLFTAALFRIGRNHLDFDPVMAHVPDHWQHALVDEGPLLEDLLQSGVYGSSSRSRQHSSGITLDAVAARNRGRAAKNGILVSLFPGADSLQGRYPYLKDRPWLLPAAWASRMGSYCAEALRRDASAAESLHLGRQRVELLRQYDILD